MGREKYVFNAQTLSYERLEVPLKKRLFRAFGFLSAVVVTGAIFMSVTNAFFPSEREKALIREIEQMEIHYESLQGQLDLMSKVLDNIQERDAAVHRAVFGADPIDPAVWEGGVGGHDRYAGVSNLPVSGDMLAGTMELADKLERQLVIQSLSLDTIQRFAEQKKEMLACLPAIKPVREDKLSRGIRAMSGYGMRIHPVLKVRKMHTGIDFTGPIGTPVQVTGNGRVVEVKHDPSGYGLHVIVDHGFGYRTLYGHLKDTSVRPGQRVTRGQQIARLGNSGKSTAPHLHYEVIHKGIKVNPIHFVIDGLTLEEYADLVQSAEESNISFDY